MKYSFLKALTLLGLLIGLPVLAQQIKISGTVNDPHDAVVVAAEVQAVNQVTQAVTKAKTDSTGTFQVVGLQPGSYQLIVRAKGFEIAKSTLIELLAGQDVTRNVKLEVDTVQTSVEVKERKVDIGAIMPPDAVLMGPAGALDPLNSPYQVIVVPQDIIQSQNLRDASDFIKFDPSAEYSRSVNAGRPYTRGFESGAVQNTRLDGMNIIITTNYPAEQLDRMEVLDGTAGALYGPTSPTGTFNYISKRPTAKTGVTAGYGLDGVGVSTGYVDLNAAHKQVGGRVNLVYADGESYTSTSELQRFDASGALDFHPNKSTTIELTGSYFNWLAYGFPSTIAYGSGKNTILPAALDSSRAGYGIPGTGQHNFLTTMSGRISHTFNSHWFLTGGVLTQKNLRHNFTSSFTLTDNIGNYKASVTASNNQYATILSNEVHLNGQFTTGSISHNVFVGTNGLSWNNGGSSAKSTSISLGTSILYNPTVFAAPKNPGQNSSLYLSGNTLQQALEVGDTLKFNEHWLLSVNSSFSWLRLQNYSTAGVTTQTNSAAGKWSPAVSLLYKLARNQTAYVSFANSYASGDAAPSTVANANQILAPYRSKQFEAGYKYAVNDRLQLAAAGFRLNKPFPFTDPQTNIYRIEGTQLDWGSSLTATGQISHKLSVMGGFQQLIPILEHTGVATTSGRDVVNVPHFMFNTLVEYKTPVRNLSVNGNVHYMSRRAANDKNTMWVDEYTTLDLGTNYQLPILKKSKVITARFDLKNVTNTRYWAAVIPTSGTSTGGSSAVPGTPRIVTFSIDTRF